MNIGINQHSYGITVIQVNERLDAFNAPALRARQEEILTAGHTRLIYDLSNISFLDSAGLAVLVSALKRSRYAGGNVKLVWPKSNAAQRILRLTRFDQVFSIANSVEEALPQF
jgi:anti-sigma B factor antagonist